SAWSSQRHRLGREPETRRRREDDPVRVVEEAVAEEHEQQESHREDRGENDRAHAESTPYGAGAAEPIGAERRPSRASAAATIISAVSAVMQRWSSGQTFKWHGPQGTSTRSTRVASRKPSV